MSSRYVDGDMSVSGVLASSVEVRLDRADRTYRPGDRVSGVVVITTHHQVMNFSSIALLIEGSTRLHLNARNVGLFEAFYSHIKPQEFLLKEITVEGSGKVQRGATEFPFEFKLEPSPGASLLDSYRGVYIHTSYFIKAEVTRGMLSTNLTKEIEFMVQVPGKDRVEKDSTSFSISPQSLENVSQEAKKRLPAFRISGKIDQLTCCITEPFSGEIVIEESDLPVRSLELQLVRVESVTYAEGIAQEATEIQNIQIGDGDACRGLVVPIYMIFPRLFTCPTLISNRFRVEFEVNLIILFQEGTMITENFPLTLYRGSN